jgi:hypothetical protein
MTVYKMIWYEREQQDCPNFSKEIILPKLIEHCIEFPRNDKWDLQDINVFSEGALNTLMLYGAERLRLEEALKKIPIFTLTIR